MTLVILGPVTNDLVVIEDDRFQKTGGATYFQTFVFEEFFSDYLAVINCGDENLVRDFPDLSKVRVIKKDDTHFFINHYPDKNNRDVRKQLSNFADIPILPQDLKAILPEKIDGFVVNPLNRYDFPAETVEYLKSFGVPVFMSVQGFLRLPGEQVNENYTVRLDKFDELTSILSGVKVIFMDESEKNIIGTDYDVDEMVITNGFNGSTILADEKIKIDAVKCDNIVDTTGCGDTYMAAYISKILSTKSVKKAGNFASSIASKKIQNFGPYKFNK